MSVGIWQILLVVAVIVLVFGLGRLPKIMGDLGSGIKSFKKGLQEGEEDQNNKLNDQSKKDQ